MWDGKTGAFKAFATLRIFGDGLQPAAISKALGLTASKCDVAESGFGTWSYSTHDVLDNLRPLEDQVLHILQLLEPRSAAIIALREKFATQVFCYFGSQSDSAVFTCRPIRWRGSPAYSSTLTSTGIFAVMPRETPSQSLQPTPSRLVSSLIVIKIPTRACQPRSR